MITRLEKLRTEMEGCSDSEWANALESLVRRHEISAVAGIPEISAGGQQKLHMGRDLSRWITVIVDDTIPDNEIHIKDGVNGRILAKIVNVGYET
jgi:hypothetical protein